MQQYWKIIVDVQFGELLDECDHLYDGAGYGTVLADQNGEAVIDYLKEWDGYEYDNDDIRTEEPRWASNGTDCVFHSGEYTLIYNATLGGVYMLFRKATESEIESHLSKNETANVR